MTAVVSLHHVTATVDTAQADLDFYAGVLGLRLVKRTVNFDNPRVYHFYYGDEFGSPGTIWTTFPYHGQGVRRGIHGAGQVTATSLSVPRGALAWWMERLRAAGVSTAPTPSAFGEAGLRCTDPSGLRIELVEADDGRPGWAAGPVTADAAVRGLHGVTLTVRQPRRTEEFVTELLGLSLIARDGTVSRLAAGGNRQPGYALDIRAADGLPDAVNGIGTVHHVALAVPDPAAQLSLREEVVRRGIAVTPVLDRQYFQSIYFREPGGVLLEIATVGPGFAIDEGPSSLGRDLKLPPWEEPNRAAIQDALPAIQVG